MRRTLPQDRASRIRRAVIRDATTVVVLGLVVVLAWQYRLGTDPHHAPAMASVQALERRLVAWEQNALDVPTTPTDLGSGVRGVRLDREDFRDRWVLVADANERCYALWWDELGVRRGRQLPRTLPCEPAEAVTTIRAGRAQSVTWQPDEPIDWTSVVPDPQRQRLWFLPVLFISGAIIASRVIHLALLAMSREPGARR